MSIIDFDEKGNWEEVVIKSQVPVLVDFYAEWCGPCKVLAPELKKLVEEKKSFNLVKVNVDDHGEIAEKYEISGLPTVKLFKNGVVVGEVVGNNIKAVRQLVEQN